MMLAYFETVNCNLNARFFSRFGYQQRFLELIRSRLQPGALILDLGAGSVDGSRLWDHGKTEVGLRFVACDLEFETLSRNPNPRRLIADAARLPFCDAEVDLIVTDNMFEHLLEPVGVLAECRRVLKPGGALVFATPHKYSYISVAASVTPLRVHYWARRIQEGKRSDRLLEACDTYYRLNTPKDIEQSAHGAGLNVRELDFYVGAPCYTLRMPPPAHLLFVLLHKLIEKSESLRRMAGISLVGQLENKAVQHNSTEAANDRQ
jgi:SAM-dependent methyltransferase